MATVLEQLDGTGRESSRASLEAPRTDEWPRESIERRAYELYLARGVADGDALSDWLQAEREVLASPATMRGDASDSAPPDPD